MIVPSNPTCCVCFDLQPCDGADSPLSGQGHTGLSSASGELRWTHWLYTKNHHMSQSFSVPHPGWPAGRDTVVLCSVSTHGVESHSPSSSQVVSGIQWRRPPWRLVPWWNNILGAGVFKTNENKLICPNPAAAEPGNGSGHASLACERGKL